MRFRTWIKRTRAGRIVWRVFIGIIGGGITVAGGVALIGPGPGILVVLAGFLGQPSPGGCNTYNI